MSGRNRKRIQHNASTARKKRARAAKRALQKRGRRRGDVTPRGEGVTHPP